MNGLPLKLTLIFDGRCGFCTRSVRYLKALDRDDRVEVLPYQGPGTPEAYGLSLVQCEASLWVVTPEGGLLSGAAAVNVALAVALGTRLPLRLYGTPGVGRLQERGYAMVARNRRRLPGDVSFCQQHPVGCR